jgi:hypothetical protein
MSILTGELITRNTAQAQVLLQREALMVSMIKSEAGLLQGAPIGIAILGKLSLEEQRLLRALRQQGAQLSCYGGPIPGAIPVARAETLGKGSKLMLLLGDDPQRATPFPLQAATQGMSQQVVIDYLSTRNVGSYDHARVRYEPFFGETEQVAVSTLAQQARQDRFRMLWIVIISLLVTIIGITNALLMSVTERFKEIGTMKCLGALSSFIRQLFVFESALIGGVGSLLGVLVGTLFPMLTYSATFGFSLVFASMNYQLLLLAGGASFVMGTLLAILAAIYPAMLASRMVPATALRSNV